MNLLYHQETFKVRGVLFDVYNKLGPGFLEKIYKRAVKEELVSRNIPFEEEKKFSIKYNNKVIGFNLTDLLVYEKIILELKAVNQLENFHLSQMLAYLKATGLKLGLLVNFGGEKLEIKRVINDKLNISA